MLHLLCINLHMVLFSKYVLAFCIWKVSSLQCVKEEVKFSNLEVNTGVFYVSICKLKTDKRVFRVQRKRGGKKRWSEKEKQRLGTDLKMR